MTYVQFDIDEVSCEFSSLSRISYYEENNELFNFESQILRNVYLLWHSQHSNGRLFVCNVKCSIIADLLLNCLPHSSQFNCCLLTFCREIDGVPGCFVCESSSASDPMRMYCSLVGSSNSTFIEFAINWAIEWSTFDDLPSDSLWSFSSTFVQNSRKHSSHLFSSCFLQCWRRCLFSVNLVKKQCILFWD